MIIFKGGGVNTVIGVIHNNVKRGLLISHFSSNVELDQFATRRKQDRLEYLNWSRAVQVVAQSVALKTPGLSNIN